MEEFEKELWKEQKENLTNLRNFLKNIRKSKGFSNQKAFAETVQKRYPTKISTIINYTSSIENKGYNFDLIKLVSGGETREKRKEFYDSYLKVLDLNEKEKEEYETLVNSIPTDEDIDEKIRIYEKEQLRLEEEKIKEEERLAKEKQEVIKEYENSVDESEKIFPEYVLQVTPTEYVESKGENLKNYDFVTVEAKDNGSENIVYKGHKFKNDNPSLARSKRDLIKEGENLEAIVIVNLDPTIGINWTHLIGTAMIPKK